MLMIQPYNKNILVELRSAFKHASTTNARTVETKKQGLCVAVSDMLMNGKELLNKVVYFDEFEDTTNYIVDGKKYALIDIDKIRGYENASN